MVLQIAAGTTALRAAAAVSAPTTGRLEAGRAIPLLLQRWTAAGTWPYSACMVHLRDQKANPLSSGLPLVTSLCICVYRIHV